MLKYKKTIAIVLIVLVLVAVYIKVEKNKRESIIEDFKSESEKIVMMFDETVIVDDNYDFVQNYIYGNVGYAILTDRDSNILIHPNTDLIGKQIPIQEIQNMIKTSLDQTSDKKEDAMMIYEYEGDERMVYIHNKDDQFILLIVAPLESY